MKKIKLISFICIFSIFLTSCSIFSNNTNEEILSEETKIIDEKNDTKDKIDLNNSNEKIKIESSKKSAPESQKENIKEKDTKQESDVENNINSNIEIGSVIYIKNDFRVYPNANDAKNNQNAVKKYKEGNYFIYKIANDAINVSKSQSQPGGWANYNEIGIDLDKISQDQFNNNDTKSNQTNNIMIDDNLSTESKSWSYAYPDNSDLLNKYDAIYKLDSQNIYLTFDNGYEYGNNTSKILDILARNNIKATFFTTGSFLRDNPSISKRIYNEGHNLSNHTENHLAQGRSSDEEIKNDILEWEKTAIDIIGLNPDTHLMRPPEGSYSEKSLAIANSLGYKTVFWNYAYADWDTNNQPVPEEALEKLLNNNESGSIVLLHSVSDTNVEILEKYIKETIKQGYTFSLLR